MKKKTITKFAIAKETLRQLGSTSLEKAVGEAYPQTYFSCPDTWYQCSTYCG